MLPYKVTKKYEKGSEQVFANFEKADDAKQFIQWKLEEDARFRVNIVYSFYELGELIETFDQGSKGAASSSESSQQTSTQAARLSPLQTTLRPSGMPLSSFKEKKDEDKK